MSVRKIIAVVAALVALPLSMAFAAGGVSWGEQYLLPEYPELANYDTQARFTALYGYSVARGGMRSGGFVLGVYLLISLQVFGRHNTEAFSSLRIQDYKQWLRLKIAPDGSVSLYSIGIERVPRR